ncbi:MAG: ATP-binding protein [Rhizobiaceae bacterium]
MPGECPPMAGKAGAGSRSDSEGVVPSHRRFRPWADTVVSAAALSFAVTGGAFAQTLGDDPSVFSKIVPSSTVDVIQFAVFVGILGSAFLSAIWLIRERGRIAQENQTLRGRIAELNALLQRSEALLNLKDQRIVAWGSGAKKPDLIGALPVGSGAPEERSAFLAFGRWLTPRSATRLENAIADLREGSGPFDLVVEAQNGTLLEVHGRHPGSHIIVRFISLSKAQAEHARLKLDHQQLLADHETFMGLAEALPMPLWLRASDGKLKWVNRAYAGAVEVFDSAAAIREGREMLGTQAREAMHLSHLAHPVFAQTLSAVVRGDRKLFAVTEYAGKCGAAGLAADRSEIEAVRAEYEHALRSHSDTLDQLTTAVAIFDAEEKLRFFNQAFQKLWGLDASFLNSAPDNAFLLDRLRAEGKLAEQPEWRRWKETILAAYRSVESSEHWWHLPDGRTIRVVANPQPKGGVTWVFENLTERIDLESRYNTAIRVQGETLDNLAEGVAVFGPDGKVRLSNPAFSRLWGLPDDFVKQKTHISEIRKRCEAMAEDSPWGDFVALTTGFDDERRDRQGQTELVNGTILSYAVIHLPNGQVMMTFVDVTDTVTVERALKDKNEALEKADQLKNDFVQHVNYELRSPLTNIIGFTELLAQGTTGPLNPRQRDYVDHISSSSSVLLTIVNDILDLATVDAGIMELDIAEVPVRRVVQDAAELIGERLREHAIRLKIDTGGAPASFHADGSRVRQILFNLLANAANYAPENSTIELSCRKEGEAIVFSVHDEGPGIAPEIVDSVFSRFEPRPNGGRRRGAGLGLSIVKSFVELHNGTVEIDSRPGKGTTVTCRFPLVPESFRTAAE